MGLKQRLLALAAAATAAMLPWTAAAQARDPTRSPHLWATVNICDTARAPNAIGIRVSMPGTLRRGDRMRALVLVQYRTARNGWRDVGRAAAKALDLGSGRRRAVQAGVTFRFRPRTPLLRARVAYEWRRGRRVVHRAQRLTSGGHGREVRVADPKGYSAPTCAIR